MYNEVPGVRASLCACVDCALAFTAVPGYHENTAVAVAQAAQAAEAVTSDYT